ncbi:hypothetical protein [Paraglaciecola sp. 2405UD69-4]|uniref:hypothetical protein n=1 Tax=Paraglaciecola sp. 2405UD69-4 TaxID=3391836 RepID=UPI0039C93232
MKFTDLNRIVNTDSDIELSVKNSDWTEIKSLVTAPAGWLTEQEFSSIFSGMSNQIVFAFESFERISKSTGIKKRLSSHFLLNWDNFDAFQRNTDILFLYLVSSDLAWVFYGNRDKWAFSEGP